MSSSYRCATCDVQYPTRRALTTHLRSSSKNNSIQHVACNEDSAQRTSSATSNTSAKQTSPPVPPRRIRGIGNQSAPSEDESNRGLYCHAVGRADSPNFLEAGEGNMSSVNFESPGTIGSFDSTSTTPESTSLIAHQLPDTFLIDKLYEHTQSGHGSTPLSSAQKSEIKLLKICKRG